MGFVKILGISFAIYNQVYFLLNLVESTISPGKGGTDTKNADYRRCSCIGFAEMVSRFHRQRPNLSATLRLLWWGEYPRAYCSMAVGKEGYSACEKLSHRQSMTIGVLPNRRWILRMWRSKAMNYNVPPTIVRFFRDSISGRSTDRK